jgi:glycosyltransferase involved in cell wall biosynthesis
MRVPQTGKAEGAGFEADYVAARHPVEASCSVLVVSCDRYQDLWAPFFHLFWRYWPDCPFPLYLGANWETFESARVATLHAGADESWSKSLRYFLGQIESDYVLLLLEDFFLDGPVSTSVLREKLNWLQAAHGTVLRLHPNPPPNMALSGNTAIGALHRLAPYRVSAQPALWDRLKLLAILRDDESAWEFENKGTVRSQASPDGYFGTYAASLRHRHVVEQGEWFRSAARYYGRQNIGCNLSARPVMGAWTALRRVVMTALRRTRAHLLALRLWSSGHQLLPGKNQPYNAQRLRVAFLTNFIPPYHKPALDCLAKRFGALRIFLSTPMEANRPWKLEWSGLDVVVQKTMTVGGKWRHPSGFNEALAIHFPLDTLGQLRRYRADVMISGEMGTRTLLAALYRRLHRKSKLIVWAEYAEATEQGRGFARGVLRKILSRNVDAFLAVGGSGARYVRSLGVGERKIFKLSYTTDVQRFSAIQLTRQAGHAQRLLYVGQLIARKGLLQFLEVLSRWAADHPERMLEFVFVGDGPLRQQLESGPRATNVALQFSGSCQYEDLPRVYGEAGVLVLPTFADTWGVTVNEALASGVPVLGSIYSQAVEELVKDGQNGWTFRAGHPEEIYGAIDRMMHTPEAELAAMRSCARRTALELTPERMADSIDAAVRGCYAL